MQFFVIAAVVVVVVAIVAVVVAFIWALEAVTSSFAALFTKSKVFLIVSTGNAKKNFAETYFCRKKNIFYMRIDIPISLHFKAAKANFIVEVL